MKHIKTTHILATLSAIIVSGTMEYTFVLWILYGFYYMFTRY
jgi:hypothetical protein